MRKFTMTVTDNTGKDVMQGRACAERDSDLLVASALFQPDMQRRCSIFKSTMIIDRVFEVIAGG